MDLQIYSWNSNVLDGSGNYTATVSPSSPFFGNATPNEVERFGFWGAAGQKQYRGNVLVLDIIHKPAVTIGTALSQIGQWFNEEDKNFYQLIAKDVNDSSRQWYVNATALGINTFSGNKITVSLQVVEPVWKVATLSTNTWSVTATGQTRNLSVIGNRNSRPRFTITPTSARTGSYGYKRFIAVANRTSNVYSDAINIVDSDWNTSTLVAGAKMQSSGNDCRIINDATGLEEYRWFGGGGINTTTTRVFVNIKLPPKIEGTVSGAISNIGAVSTITLKPTAANKAALVALKAVSYKFVAIDMGTGTHEIFKFTDVNVNAYQITGCTRAQRNTTNQLHSDGATLRHFWGFYVLYGNSTAIAPTVDDGYKPMFDLASSTNTSRVWADFYDATKPNRSAMWKPQVVKNVGGLSEIYTATTDLFNDIASVMGQAIKVYKVGTVLRAPQADLIWSYYHPAGMTTLTWSGKKYRYSSSWATAQMEKSVDGKIWSAVATAEVKPTASATWENLSAHSSVALGATYYNVRSRFFGSVATIEGNLNGNEISDLTAVIDSTRTPLVSFAAEENNNFMECRIVNNTTGNWFEISQIVPLNTSIVVDTELFTATLADGTSTPVRLDDETRQDWLPLLPNQTNVLQYNETGAVAITVLTEWRDRNA